MPKFKSLVLFVFLLIVVSFSACKNESDSAQKAKYVFYFIGDGMGNQQITTTQAYLASQVDNKIGTSNLAFTQFPVVGLAETFAYNRYVTGSAAAGTALATGNKTSINTIGLSHDYSDTLYSIAHHANNNGFSVGVATSVSIDHATPAAFYAHQTQRSYYHSIAHDMINSGFRYFGGGGLRDPKGKKSDSPKGNVYQHGKENGVLFTNNLSASDDTLSNYQTIVYSVPKPSYGNTLQYQIDAKDEHDINLKDIAKQGINVLSSSNSGFFFMIEGGKIDWACHDNDAATTIMDMIAFSDAIDLAVEFYNEFPDETLIVVTSDHETGGMSLGNSYNGYNTDVSFLNNQKYSLEVFNRKVRDFKASHNGSPTFDQVKQLLVHDFSLGMSYDSLPSSCQEAIRSAYAASIGNKTDEQQVVIKTEYGSFDPIAVVAVRTINRLAGIGWSTGAHTGSHVPVYAMGAGQHLFNGQMDNTDIPKRIARAMGIDNF